MTRSVDHAEGGTTTRPAADACPYRRPFPEDFDDCPTYQGTLFVGLDLSCRPLRPTRTCRFLAVGETPGARGAFYPRCSIGDSEARQRWLRGLDASRLANLRAFRDELSIMIRPYLEELWRVKGRQLVAQGPGREQDATDRTTELQSVSQRFAGDLDAFLARRSERLEELGLPREATMNAILLMLDAFVHQRTTEQTHIELPGSLLDQFPPEVQALLRPS